MQTMTGPPPRTMQELYEYLPEGVPVQLINNQLIMSPAPKDPHQQLIVDISYELIGFVKKKKLGKTRVAPSDVYFNERNIFQPDLYFVNNNNLDKFKESGFHGVPDLIIEILSKSTEKYDKKEKFNVYESSGVKELWLVDPDTMIAIGYSLNNGRYKKIAEQKNLIKSLLLGTEFRF